MEGLPHESLRAGLELRRVLKWEAQALPIVVRAFRTVMDANTIAARDRRLCVEMYGVWTHFFPKGIGPSPGWCASALARHTPRPTTGYPPQSVRFLELAGFRLCGHSYELSAREKFHSVPMLRRCHPFSVPESLPSSPIVSRWHEDHFKSGYRLLAYLILHL